MIQAVKKIKPTMLCMLIIAIMITGCDSGSPSEIVYEDVKVGTDSLSIEFLEQAPPRQVQEDTNFVMSMKVINQGAYDIENGLISVGVEADNVYITSWDESRIIATSYDLSMALFNLEGKKDTNPEGGLDYLTIRAKTRELSSQMETLTTNIAVTGCYQYEAEFNDIVCIDTDPSNLKQMEQTCEVEEISASGQGAPVAVTRVVPRMNYGDDSDEIIPKFDIYIENLGDGQVVDKNMIRESCSALGVSYENLNKVEVKASLSADSLSCQPEEIQLKQGNNKVICTLKGGVKTTRPSYETPLVIDLEYGYVQTASKQVEIRKDI